MAPPQDTYSAKSDQFLQVHDVKELIQILESRLPKSAHMYNTVLIHHLFKHEIKFYKFEPGRGHENSQLPSPDVWIICNYNRQDVKQYITTSVPEGVEITSEIKNAFLDSKIVDWNQRYMFAYTDLSVSDMIYEIAETKSRLVQKTQYQVFCCNREDAIALEIPHDSDVIVKPLDTISGSEFLCNNWPHSIEGSLDYIKDSIERLPSCGIYTKRDERLVSGIMTSASGYMGMLYTDIDFRNRSYGKLCMQNLMKQFALMGLIPCSAVAITNESSRIFHAKIGMKPGNIVDFIYHTGIQE